MVTYRLATADDYIKINEFHNRIDKPTRSIEQFYWEFRDGSCGPSIYVVAEDGDKIVGTNCVIIIHLVDSLGKLFKSGKSEDTLVDPNYRGQNIFNNIYEYLFEECKKQGVLIIWGFTSAYKPFKKLGFEIPFRHEQGLAVNHFWKSYRFLKTLNPKNKIADKIKIAGLCLISLLKFKFNIKQNRLNYNFSEVNNPNDELEALIQSNLEKTPSSFAIHQNQSYQNWRIYSNPNYFRINTFVFKNKKGRTVAIFEVNTGKNNVSYINQSTFHTDLNENEKNKMIRIITIHLFEKGSHLVRNWLFCTNTINKNEIKNFENSGYIHIKRGIGFVWKELDNVDLTATQFYLSRIASQGID